ncbi:hypothetical protein HCH_04671 [Hahella chejuensis KCTC 2396]|uniref:Uncharacterized protein n=1 Tax=Hahella chejuensis (strain KCTC 2396) TaxID=349521 RepID=Q2SDA4_HAHCH|nr:hypothetical protein HCH_04671 [Hahella chejuensis KCTC 2396]
MLINQADKQLPSICPQRQGLTCAGGPVSRGSPLRKRFPAPDY